ncbi:hypothetical protein DFH27DRAFT_574271 [Peziza echinospora]|nr:hypothetical protein DFH27DRAFT_574271 [Peziza echinospora]
MAQSSRLEGRRVHELHVFKAGGEKGWAEEASVLSFPLSSISSGKFSPSSNPVPAAHIPSFGSPGTTKGFTGSRDGLVNLHKLPVEQLSYLQSYIDRLNKKVEEDRKAAHKKWKEEAEKEEEFYLKETARIDKEWEEWRESQDKKRRSRAGRRDRSRPSPSVLEEAGMRIERVSAPDEFLTPPPPPPPANVFMSNDLGAGRVPQPQHAVPFSTSYEPPRYGGRHESRRHVVHDDYYSDSQSNSDEDTYREGRNRNNYYDRIRRRNPARRSQRMPEFPIIDPYPVLCTPQNPADFETTWTIEDVQLMYIPQTMALSNQGMPPYQYQPVPMATQPVEIRVMTHTIDPESLKSYSIVLSRCTSSPLKDAIGARRVYPCPPPRPRTYIPDTPVIGSRSPSPLREGSARQHMIPDSLTETAEIVKKHNEWADMPFIGRQAAARDDEDAAESTTGESIVYVGDEN